MQAPASFDDSDLPTVDSVLDEKRKQIKARLEARDTKEGNKPTPPPPAQQDQQRDAITGKSENHNNTTAAAAVTMEGAPGALEDEAGQEGAFNPETGEINWDCPCLGGMAHGPCGEEFKTAFSCFVHSEEEPKGMDCIERFQYVKPNYFTTNTSRTPVLSFGE